jgi:Cu/Ag efflux protein CusF
MLRLILSCLVAMTAACAASSPASPPAPTAEVATASSAKGGVREATITATMVVEKVDLASRNLTLKASDGEVETVQVGDEVRNLPQVKKGDHVVITYYEAVAFQVLPSKKAVLSMTGLEGKGHAKAGEKPGAAAAREIHIVAKIEKLDPKAGTAVLLGPKGKTFTVDVQDRSNFEKVKVGDVVEIVARQALAVDVHPAH